MTQVITQDLREKEVAFESLPCGSWFLFDEYAYIKVKPFTIAYEKTNEVLIPQEAEYYNSIGSDGVAYYFAGENVEPIEHISLIIEK